MQLIAFAIAFKRAVIGPCGQRQHAEHAKQPSDADPKRWIEHLIRKSSRMRGSFERPLPPTQIKRVKANCQMPLPEDGSDHGNQDDGKREAVKSSHHTPSLPSLST